MKINWIVRFKNKTFWMAFIPALAVLVTSILNLFGIEFNLDGIVDSLLKIVAAVFSVLAVIGVVVDPTTDSIGDSERALGYFEPWKDPPEGD